MTTSVERRKEEPGPAVENCPGQKAGAAGGRAGGIVGPGRSGRQQAGEASPLSSLHHSTARWSQVGAQRRPRQYSRLRPAVLGCGRCSHSLLWRRTWGMMGLRTVHPNTGWVALEVGRQQACKSELQVAFPCAFLEARDPCFLCPQQICAGPQLSPV